MVPLEFYMRFVKPNFSYPTFQKFVESGARGFGGSFSAPTLSIQLNGYQRPDGILYLLDIRRYHVGSGWGCCVLFAERKIYQILNHPLSREEFFAEALRESKGCPELMDFILWNDL